MRIFVYEHITGGGTLKDGSAGGSSGSLLIEGTAMLKAVVADFSAVPGVQVAALWDSRLGDVPRGPCRSQPVGNAAEHRRALAQLAAECDATLLIAPELSGQLLTCCRSVTAVGAKLISPDERSIALASDKMQLARCFTSEGVPAPPTMPVTFGAALPGEFPYPAVLKPIDGTASVDVSLVRSPGEWRWPARGSERTGWLLQEYCSGTPVSVALLCGPGGTYPLVPCRQRLSDDDQFRYLGGELPLPAEMADRATRLAQRAVKCALPGVVGFVGVDLVLGDEPDGDNDFAIEINPRLTTSYVGLRVAARDNLAAAMLAIAENRQPELRFSDKPLQFDANGRVR